MGNSGVWFPDVPKVTSVNAISGTVWYDFSNLIKNILRSTTSMLILMGFGLPKPKNHIEWELFIMYNSNQGG